MCSCEMKISTDENWYLSEYKTDIYEHLKILEKERKTFYSRSPQLNYRENLIRWLKEVMVDVKFCRVTFHLAVFLLDFFMDSHMVKPEKLTLIAFTCLVLAGKFEEQENKIPKISEMNKLLKSAYVQTDILYLERKILKYFNWRLTLPTAVHFAEYYLNFAIVPEDVCTNCSHYRHVHSAIKHRLYDYLDRSLEDCLLISYSPSFVASSCLLAVRVSFQLIPTWPEELEKVTSYSECELKYCCGRILKYKEKCIKQKKRKLEQSPDQGYETEKGGNVTPKCKKE